MGVRREWPDAQAHRRHQRLAHCRNRPQVLLAGGPAPRRAPRVDRTGALIVWAAALPRSQAPRAELFPSLQPLGRPGMFTPKVCKSRTAFSARIRRAPTTAAIFV